MLHRQLTMSEERTSYQQAERTADMMNQITIFHSSPSDFLHTQEESADESIDTYKEYKQLVEEYSDEHFVPCIVERFCKMVYEDDEHFIFFKPFCNLYFSVYADALLWYQQGRCTRRWGQKKSAYCILIRKNSKRQIFALKVWKFQK